MDASLAKVQMSSAAPVRMLCVNGKYFSFSLSSLHPLSPHEFSPICQVSLQRSVPFFLGVGVAYFAVFN